MPTHALEARVRRLRDLAVIDLHGEFDGRAEAALEAAYARAEGQAPAAIALNFGGVDYMNSKGIALIVVLLRQATAAGRPLMASPLYPGTRPISSGGPMRG